MITEEVSMSDKPSPAILVTEDRWEHLAGARFVGPAEYLRVAPEHALRSLRSLTWEAITRALAAAADEKGLLLDFHVDEFFGTYVTAALRDEDDPADWSLTWDRFTALALMDAEIHLLENGLVGHRGNGDTVDYRLALPGE